MLCTFADEEELKTNYDAVIDWCLMEQVAQPSRREKIHVTYQENREEVQMSEHRISWSFNN